LIKVARNHFRHIFVPDMWMAIGTFFGGLTTQISPVGQKTAARHSGSGLQPVVTATAGRIIGEFRPALFRVADPVKRFHINGKILDYISGAGDSFGHDILDETSVRQMAIHALGGKTLGISTPMDRLGPGITEGVHGMAGDTESIGVSRFNHKTRSQHRQYRKRHTYDQAEPPALSTFRLSLLRRGHPIISFEFVNQMN